MFEEALGPGGLTPDAVEYYADGAWYDAEYVHLGGGADVAYYASVAAETDGRVLELACGTGRLTIPMAQAGGTVVGVDVGPGMIARANLKRADLPPADQARLRFLIDDMRTARLGETFEAVVLAFNTLMHMTRDEDLADTLETAAAHLRPGGLFHLDLHTPHPAVVPREDPDGRYDPQEMIDPHTGERWIVTENNGYDARWQINTMRFYYRRAGPDGLPSGPERKIELRLRVLFPRELDSWLHRAGFEIAGEWDDFERSRPFSGLGGRRVITARRR